jgi:hypothetical protein
VPIYRLQPNKLGALQGSLGKGEHPFLKRRPDLSGRRFKKLTSRTKLFVRNRMVGYHGRGY